MTRYLIAECALNLRILFRQPGFWVPTVLFPAMLYSFFGANSGGGQWAANAMASFCVYAVLGVGFFQFGVSVAQDRESAFATWQRSLPGGIGVQWVARVVAALFFVTIAVVLVVVMALVLTDQRPGAAPLARLAVVCLASSVTAIFMGIALGSFTPARAAVPLANLIYLPLAYLGGLWVPPMFMPDAIAAISVWTPTRAMGELSWAAINGTGFETRYAVILLGWTAGAMALAGLAQLREGRRA